MQSEVQFSGISALHALLVLSSSKLFQRYAIIKHISQIIFHIEELYSVIMDGKTLEKPRDVSKIKNIT